MFQNPTITLGTHIIIDLQLQDNALLSHADVFEKAVMEVVETVGIKVISTTFRQFDPVGVTGFLILSESHFAAHTWPQYNYVAMDLFLCGQINIDHFFSCVKEVFCPTVMTVKTLLRVVPQENIEHGA